MADLLINTFHCHDNLWYWASKFSLTYTYTCLLATECSPTHSCVLDSIIYFVLHNMPKCIALCIGILKLPVGSTSLCVTRFTHAHTHTERLWGRASYICSVSLYTLTVFVYVVHNSVYRNKRLQFQVDHQTPTLFPLSPSPSILEQCAVIKQSWVLSLRGR